MFPFLVVVAGLYVYETSKPKVASKPDLDDKDRGSGGGTGGSGGEKPALVPPDGVVVRTAADYYRGDETALRDALTRVLTMSADPLSTFSAKTLPSGVEIGKQAFGAEAPLQGGERVVLELVDTEKGLGAIEGVYAGPADPDEGAATVLVDRVSLQRSTPFEVPGKYAVPASSKHGYHDRLRRVRWDVQAPAEKGLKTFAVAPSLDVGDKVTVLLRDDYGTYVVAIAQVREVKEGGRIRLLLLSPYRVLHDEGKGDVAFTRMLAQGLVDTTTDRLVDPKSLKKD